MALQQGPSAVRIPQIEVDFPDLAPWAAGNTGVPCLWTFDSARAGPHVALQALTHGNEVCGAVALDQFLRDRLRPVRGRLSFCFANVAAHHTWAPGEPYKSRFVDEDFNRLWDPAVLEGSRDSAELRRARQLRPFYDTVDYLLDIHSMSDPCPPLMLAGVRAALFQVLFQEALSTYQALLAQQPAEQRDQVVLAVEPARLGAAAQLLLDAPTLNAAVSLLALGAFLKRQPSQER